MRWASQVACATIAVHIFEAKNNRRTLQRPLPPPYVAPKRPLGERLQQGVSNQLMAGSVGFAAVLLVIAWLLGLSELYGYLKVGNWPHYVLWKVLHDLVPVSMVSWVEFPRDWFGLHKVVSWVFLKCPVEAVLLALSFVVFVVGAKLADSLDIRPRPRRSKTTQ